MYLQKPLEITILNDANKEITNFLKKAFLPESILVSIHNSNQLEALSNYPFFTGKNFDSKTTNVFVCRDFTCSLPLQTIEDIKKVL